MALEKLDRLATQRLVQTGADMRPFYFQLSEIVREYLGARFGFLALEMTTEELMDELRPPRAARPGAGRGRRAGWSAATW